MRKQMKIALSIAIGISLICLIAFVGFRQSDRRIEKINVVIKDLDGHYFIDESEVLQLLDDSSMDYIVGMRKKELDLKVLEQRVRKNNFVKDVQIYHDVAGRLTVKIEQTRPIARLLLGSGRDKYIDQDGKLIPLNARYTPRVMLISMTANAPWQHDLNETEDGKKLLEFVNFVDKDPFWRAQIAQTHIKKNGELVLEPQVTRQDIYFGTPEDIAFKFKKLKVFYTDILPSKGWNTYTAVNLKFKNQIICQTN